MPNSNTPRVTGLSFPVGLKQEPLPHRKIVKSRLHHAVRPETLDTLGRCQAQILDFAGPVNGLDPGLCERWASQRQSIRKDFQPIHDVVVLALIKEGIGPDTVTSDQLDCVLQKLRKLDRQIHPAAKDSRESDLKAIFSTAVRGMMLAAQSHEGPANWSHLVRVSGRAKIREENKASLPENIARELRVVEKYLNRRVSSRTTQEKLNIFRDCFNLLHAHGHYFGGLRDILEKPMLSKLANLLKGEAVRDETCWRYFEALRWLATEYFDSAEARQRVTFWITQYRAKIPKDAAVIDAPKILYWADKSNLRNLILDLAALAETGGGTGQPRRRIRVSSGACLCLLVIFSLVHAGELPELHFDNQGQAVWSKKTTSEVQELWFKDKQVQKTLAIPIVSQALAGFRALFIASYGRMPCSLADGLNFTRDYASVMPSRMQPALALASKSLVPKDLQALVVVLLLRDGRDAFAVAHCAGYRSLTSFHRRYEPVLRLVASLDARPFA